MSIFFRASNPRFWAAIGLVFIFSSTIPATATLLVNGDFETGDLTGWTWTPDLLAEDQMFAESAFFFGSRSFRVNPGAELGGTGEQGGTLSQSVEVEEGQTYRATGTLFIQETPLGFGIGNRDGGTITVLIGDTPLHLFDVMSIAEGAVKRNDFIFDFTPADSGTVEFSLRFTRRAQNDTRAIFHFADDLTVTQIPAPGSIVTATIVASILLRRRNKPASEYSMIHGPRCRS